ncbi:MAG: sigma-70 family RNA polymerase sigma factor [Deltaproteobacteria bacterium]|nr:sigma-70 family RNA polymerase sigma factor [Deltaproteobacteria bacterium]
MAETGTPIRLEPERWVEQHGDCMYRFALARLRSPDLAENAVQEALLGAYEARKSFSGRSSERTWLVGILKRKVFDHFRKASRERPVEDVVALAEPSEEMFDGRGHWKMGPSQWGSAPDTATERSELREILQECINGLPDRLAQVFTMKEIDGQDGAEVCHAGRLWSAPGREQRLRERGEPRILTPTNTSSSPSTTFTNMP